MSSAQSTTAGRRRRVTAGVPAVMLFALLITTPLAAARQAGRGTVSGTITDMAGKPLAGVEITLEATDGSRTAATTDRRGRFSLEVAAGDYLVGLEREGYARFESPLTVPAGGRQVVSAQLLDAAAGRRSEAAQAFNAGVAAYEEGDREVAKKSFLAAVAADPTLIEAHRILADIHFGEEAWAEAARAAERYLAERPDDRQTRLMAYEAYRELGDDARVVETRRALATDAELAPKLAVHAFNEGAVAERQGDAETAEERFEEALVLDGKLAAAHFALATLDYRAERYGKAGARLERGLALEPTSSQGRRLAFLVEEALGDSQAASEAMEAYAEVDAPGAAELLFKRGELDFRNGDSEAARRRLAKVVELVPDHAKAHHILGLAHLTGDTGEAREHLRRFLELAPDDPEAAAVREILASLE